MNLYDKALKIATKAHEGQVDKAGVAYIQHPLHVASLVDTEEEKAVALLHDVLEDSDLSIDYFRERGIPDSVIIAVSILTKEKGIGYFDYLRNVKNNPIAKKVKLADLQHNSDLSRIRKITETDIRRQTKYKRAIAYLN